MCLHTLQGSKVTAQRISSVLKHTVSDYVLLLASSRVYSTDINTLYSIFKYM